MLNFAKRNQYCSCLIQLGPYMTQSSHPSKISSYRLMTVYSIRIPELGLLVLPVEKDGLIMSAASL